MKKIVRHVAATLLIISLVAMLSGCKTDGVTVTIDTKYKDGYALYGAGDEFKFNVTIENNTGHTIEGYVFYSYVEGIEEIPSRGKQVVSISNPNNPRPNEQIRNLIENIDDKDFAYMWDIPSSAKDVISHYPDIYSIENMLDENGNQIDTVTFVAEVVYYEVTEDDNGEEGEREYHKVTATSKPVKVIFE